jgi:hypothetical protein
LNVLASGFKNMELYSYFYLFRIFRHHLELKCQLRGPTAFPQGKQSSIPNEQDIALALESLRVLCRGDIPVVCTGKQTKKSFLSCPARRLLPFKNRDSITSCSWYDIIN